MRVVAWFSCGVASAVAARFALEKYGDTGADVEVVYCDTSESEHPDNLRFLGDIQRWLGSPIVRLKSEHYANIDDVFESTGYMAGIKGARCTVEMKKIPRFHFQRADDIHVFGLTSEESDRIDRFTANNHDLRLDWILRDLKITKAKCCETLKAYGITLPALYAKGYKNNNCLGCVKATSATYWNMTRRDFPDVFAKRAEQSRRLGVRLTRVRGERVFLDELPPNYLPAEPLENVSCGPECADSSIVWGGVQEKVETPESRQDWSDE